VDAGPAVRAALEAAGARVEDVAVVRPRLEDAFLYLTERVPSAPQAPA
jgi:hypothetical protein